MASPKPLHKEMGCIPCATPNEYHLELKKKWMAYQQELHMEIAGIPWATTYFMKSLGWISNGIQKLLREMSGIPAVFLKE